MGVYVREMYVHCCMCSYVCATACIWEQIGGPQESWAVKLAPSLIQRLLLSVDKDWLSTNPNSSHVSATPSTGFTGIRGHTRVFTGHWYFNIRSWCLHRNKSFPPRHLPRLCIYPHIFLGASEFIPVFNLPEKSNTIFSLFFIWHNILMMYILFSLKTTSLIEIPLNDYACVTLHYI